MQKLAYAGDGSLAPLEVRGVKSTLADVLEAVAYLCIEEAPSRLGLKLSSQDIRCFLRKILPAL